MAIISVTNQKGGVAKTTTALHLAIGLAEKYPDKKVLFVDLDQQRNATGVLLGKTDFSPQETVFQIFVEKKVAGSALHNTSYANLLAIPASLQLVEIESMLSGAVDGFFRLSESFEGLKTEFDFIVMDCPPSLSVITINALVAASDIVIPLQVSKFSIDGIHNLLDVVNTVQKRYNPQLRILGGLFTMYNPRTTIAQTMSEEIGKSMKIFKTTIPNSVAVEESHLLRESLYQYAPKNKVTTAYLKLTQEVANAVKKR